MIANVPVRPTLARPGRRLAFAGCAAWLTRVAWRLVVALSHRRQLAILDDRDDRLLADIGLTRTDVRDAGAAPFWNDPTAVLAKRAEGHRLEAPAAMTQKRSIPDLH